MAIKSYNFAESTEEKMAEIATHRDIGNKTEVIRFCVSEVHAKMFPDYIYKPRAKNSVEQKVLNEIQKENLKQSVRENKARAYAVNICTLLEGTVSVNAAGKEVCDYTHYSFNGPQRIQKTPMHDELSALNDDTPRLQYQPFTNNKEDPAVTKAKVLAILAKETGAIPPPPPPL